MQKQSYIYIFISIFFCLLSQKNSFGQEQVKVLHISLKTEIDPRAERYIELAFQAAKTQNVDYVLLEMDTYGGRVDNADAIVKHILDYEKPVFVFINNNAASAGAWIAIACDKIYMVESGTIGAATVVNQTGEQMPDKYQSYMRGKMRATAEDKGRNPAIAEAMVDASLAVENVIDSGKVLTFTTKEAIKNKYCEGNVQSIENILSKNNIINYEVIPYELSWTDQVIAFFLNPYLSGILLLVMLGGIYFELQSPGIGFPLIAAIIASVLYFVPYYFHHLAESWELILFGIGILLIAAEIFVIPGFGVAGLLGIGTVLGSAFLMMVNNDGFSFDFVNTQAMFDAMTTVIIGLAGAIALVVFALPKLLNSSSFKRRVSLEKSMEADEGYTSNTYSEDMVGSIGITHTVLRPSGKMDLDGEIYDVSTRGDFIEKDVKIIIISQEGGSFKVKKWEEDKQ